MDPKAAGEVLIRTIKDPTKPMTVADASVASGLAQRDAEAGLTWLTSEYRGHLRVTEDGDLVHLFPYGFEKPWETKEAWQKVVSSVFGVLAGVGRFIVRAWLLIVMVTYALLFIALIIGLTFARQGSSDRDDSSPAFSALGGLFRMIADAFFWTFHPFSPLYIVPYRTSYDGYTTYPAQEEEKKVPFYEKVNRFVFGPPKEEPNPQAARAKILEEIRLRKGRIGLADVMRITGLPREEADPLMARLMLDHEGTVDVGEQGGIVYRFEALRRSALEGAPPAIARPAWEKLPEAPPLTGNTGGANFLVALLNGLNLLASGWVIANGLTISNIMLLFDKHRPPVLPDDGMPIALGLVPFVFSLALFVLPVLRALLQARKKKQIAEERARLAILREVLARAPHKQPVTDETLRVAYRIATGGSEPTSKEITRHVVDLGGDVDPGPDGQVRYRFADLEAEAEALEEERANAPAAEARLGRVVFASDR